jgi:hypothetical protein
MTVPDEFDRHNITFSNDMNRVNSAYNSNLRQAASILQTELKNAEDEHHRTLNSILKEIQSEGVTNGDHESRLDSASDAYISLVQSIVDNHTSVVDRMRLQRDADLARIRENYDEQPRRPRGYYNRATRGGGRWKKRSMKKRSMKKRSMKKTSVNNKKRSTKHKRIIR